MFIEQPLKPVCWADRTMTVLRRNRFQACEQDLAGLPQHSLFDPSVTDQDAELFYSSSWYAQEEKKPALHSIEGLRARVLEDLPTAMSLLTPEEHDLLVRALVLRGHLPLIHPESLFPAISLVRRLWGVLVQGPFVRHLELPAQVCLAAVITLANESYRPLHDAFARIFETVDNTLYLAGMLPAETVVQDVLSTFASSQAVNRPLLCRISLRSGFETCVDAGGRLYLVHSGLADPVSLLKSRQAVHDFLPVTQNTTDLSAAYESLTALEDPLYDCLLSLLQDVCRQETTPEDTVEDLIILVKQGADYASLREVLSSRLVCLPTQEMEAALRDLHERIPRWLSLQMSRLQ